MSKPKQAKRPDHTRMAQALFWLGFSMAIIGESLVGTWLFYTSDHSITVGALPVHAVVKTCAGLAAACIAVFGGAIAAGWMLSSSAPIQRRGRLAMVVVLLASSYSVFNQASALGYFRRSAEAPVVRKSEEYRQALVDVQALSTALQQPLGYEERDGLEVQLAAAQKVVQRGSQPLGSEAPDAGDWFGGLLMHLLAILPAMAFAPLTTPTRRAAEKAEEPVKGPRLQAV